MDKIESVKNPLAQGLKQLLRESDARRRHKAFACEGPKQADEALKAGLKPLAGLFTDAFAHKPGQAGLLGRLQAKGARMAQMPEGALNRLADTQAPQGLLVSFGMPEWGLSAALPKAGSLLVAVEGLQDPGNLGTLIRSARACSAEAVLLSEGCADVWAPKTLRAGAGAQMHMPVVSRVDLGQAIKHYQKQGFQGLALDLQGSESHLGLKLQGPILLVVGTEGQGLLRETANCCAKRIKIEYPGDIESLNAGVAATILLFEISRQRLEK
jgi:TrmH family RNA methyltransferase